MPAFAALHIGDSDLELAIDVDSRYAARLRQCKTTRAVVSTRVKGVYAITGGLGGLGLRAATLLVAQGVVRVLLASRSGRVARGGQGLEARLQTLHQAASVVACDSSDINDLARLAGGVEPLLGFMYAAGASDSGLLASPEGPLARRLHWMNASKAVGAWLLQCSTMDRMMETRLLFSSVASGLGHRGQANYAAANACLDSQAHSWRCGGLPAASVQWPLVGDAGMGADASSIVRARQVTIAGFAGISLEAYAEALERQLSPVRSSVVAVQTVHRANVRELLDDLADATPLGGESTDGDDHAHVTPGLCGFKESAEHD